MPTATHAASNETRADERLLQTHPFGRLPTWQPAARQIVVAATDEGLPAIPLVEAIAWDPVVAARVLKLAATSRRGDRPAVTTLSAAVARLGRHVTALCALDFSLAPSRDLDLDPRAVVWRRSQRTAMVARALAHLLDRGIAETAYVCALVSRIGQLILLEQDRPGYQARLLETQGDVEPHEELRLHGVRHQELTAAVLKSWGLSSELWQPILDSADQEAAHAESVRQLVAIRLAEDEVSPERSLAVMTGILIVAGRIELLMDQEQRAAALDIACSDRYGVRLSGMQAETLLTGIENDTRIPYCAGRPVQDDTDPAKLLMRAFDRRAEIVLQTGDNMLGMAWRIDQLQAQCEQLTDAEPLSVRVANSLRHAAFVSGVCLTLLAAGAVVMLILVYFLKSALGIDVIQGQHLGDLLG